MKTGEHFDTRNEIDNEIVTALDKISLIGSIKKSIKILRIQASTLENSLDSIKEKSVDSPEGSLFAITSRSGYFNVGFNFGTKEEPNWNLNSKVKFPTRRSLRDHDLASSWIFQAYRIDGAKDSHDDSRSSVFAYSLDYSMRCEISSDDYCVDLVDEVDFAEENYDIVDSESVEHYSQDYSEER